MPRYVVAYKNANSETVRERLDAPSRGELLSDLRAKGAIPISIKQADGGDAADKKKAKSERVRTKSAFFSKKIKLGELAVVFRTLSTMLSGGLPIIDSVSDVGAQAGNPRLREVLLSVSGAIREGASLSAAMEKHPGVFSNLMISMTRAGEESGHMGAVLNDLSDYLESQVELRRKIKAGTRYPLFILGFFTLAVGILFVFILPRFAVIFRNLDADLPALTALVMGLSSALASNIVFILFGLAALITGGVLFKRTETGKRFFDRLVLRLPVVGPMAQKIVIARLSRTLGLLIASGIPVVESLAMSGQISGNYVFERNIDQIKTNIIRGSTLSEEMKGRAYFPMMLIRMTAAGEATGSLADMLQRVSQHFTREASVSIDSMLALLEPLLLALLGVVVGVVILAVYLPIFQLATAM